MSQHPARPDDPATNGLPRALIEAALADSGLWVGRLAPRAILGGLAWRARAFSFADVAPPKRCLPGVVPGLDEVRTAFAT